MNTNAVSVGNPKCYTAINHDKSKSAKKELKASGDRFSRSSADVSIDKGFQKMVDRIRQQETAKSDPSKEMEKGFTVLKYAGIGLMVGCVIGSVLAGPAAPIMGTLAAAGLGSMGMTVGLVAGIARASAMK